MSERDNGDKKDYVVNVFDRERASFLDDKLLRMVALHINETSIMFFLMDDGSVDVYSAEKSIITLPNTRPLEDVLKALNPDITPT